MMLKQARVLSLQNKYYILLLIILMLLPLWVIKWPPLHILPLSQDLNTKISNTKEKVVSIPNTGQKPLQTHHPVVKKYIIEKGDTLQDLLINAGMKPVEAFEAIKSFSNFYDPRNILPGQELTFLYTRNQIKGEDGNQILGNQVFSINYRPNLYQEYLMIRNADGKFSTKLIKQKISISLQRVSGIIESSLYSAALKVGLPLPIIMEFIRIYSWDVDFQRSIRKNDRFELLFEKQLTEGGHLARYGEIVYAKLLLGKDVYPLYRYKSEKGSSDYYDHKGNSARKALMRTPINGARLSSGYGSRRHPILGFTKLHRGVDFAAPIGTPVFAAGSGTVVFRSRNGSYGNYIRIRHNSEYSTAYAHLSKFRRTVTKGSRVRQGQIIGYVGTTGRSTGPHLHYEIIRRGRQTNPMKVKMPSGKSLIGINLKKFLELKSHVNKLFLSTPPAKNKGLPKP